MHSRAPSLSQEAGGSPRTSECLGVLERAEAGVLVAAQDHSRGRSSLGQELKGAKYLELPKTQLQKAEVKVIEVTGIADFPLII